MIEIEALSKSFGAPRGEPVTALDDVSLTARRGGATGLLGPNGAGKTTLMRILAGLLRPTSGRVRITGDLLAPSAARELGRVGLLTEEAGLPGRLTPLWHLTLHAGLRGASRRDAFRLARDLASAIGLGPVLESPMGRLSKGNRLKVGLARALVRDPEVLLLDEPTANLDIESAAEVRSLIAGLASRGRTILLATHNAREAESLCGNIVVLSAGRVLAVGTAGDLARRAALAARLEVTLSHGAAEAAGRIARLGWVGAAIPAGTLVVIEPSAPEIPLTALRDIQAAVDPAEVLELRRVASSLEETYLALRRGETR